MSFTFDDVLILPKFSLVESRKDVDTSTLLGSRKLNIGVISSNMDTVTGADMAKAMSANGGLSCLHRFQTIESNIKQYKDSGCDPMVSVGLGKVELERATALIQAGCSQVLIDLAHGACMRAVDQVKELRNISKDIDIFVGNFATANSIKEFIYHLGKADVTGFKVGIGGGAMCTTRRVAGVGVPSLSSFEDCVQSGYPIIGDGGIRDSGDLAKSFAVGVKAVMCGRLFAGTNESPGEIIDHEQYDFESRTLYSYGKFKKYRGSASLESYQVQGKVSEWRTAEGESTLVPYTGPVKNTLQQLEAGLRSAMSYVGAFDLEEFKSKAEFIKITGSGLIESMAHGKM